MLEAAVRSFISPAFVVASQLHTCQVDGLNIIPTNFTRWQSQ